MNFKNVVHLFCSHPRGRYSGKFTYGTTVFSEVSEVIEKISTLRKFPNLPKLFLGPYISIKRLRKRDQPSCLYKLGGATLLTFHEEH